MNKIFILALFEFFLIPKIKSQNSNSDFGVSFIENFASQTLYNPQIPEDGKTQYNSSALPGLAIFYQMPLYKKASNRIELSFASKGCELPFQQGDIFGPPQNFQYLTLQNRFRFISIGDFVKYSFGKTPKPVNFFVFLGVSESFLVGKHIESDIFPLNNQLPEKSYRDFKKFTTSGILGTGVSIKNMIDLSFAWNRDITNFVKKPDLEVKNWVWQFKIDCNIDNLTKK